MESNISKIIMNKNSKNIFLILKANFKRNYELYFLSLPVFIYMIVFHYVPMYGIQIAFKDFIPAKGFSGSPWVGFEHFQRFFSSYKFWGLIKNTLGISIYQLLVGFPLPIILAIMLNEVEHKWYKKTVQMITYAPHFISTVVMAGILFVFLSPSSGIINQIRVLFGGQPISFLSKPEWFKTVYVFSGVWQSLGWSSIIYISALSGIDPQLHEAAIVDGANKFQRIWHIDIPGIIPTAIILLILNVGSIMSVGFEKVFLLQNELNMSASDVISTYVYKVGIQGAEYSFSTAVGLFNSIINFILLIIVNTFSKHLGETSLW